MPKNKKLKPDTVLKNYWQQNEEFADFFNAVLFSGKQVIKPEMLTDKDTESSNTLSHKQYLESTQAARDILKLAKQTEDVEYVLLGIENQQGIHYAMPFRVIEYDSLMYKKQRDQLWENYKNTKELTKNEFLSKMKKTDKFIPVVTVVIYYGEERWDGPKSLFELLDLPEELKPFLNDFKINLVEVRNNDLVFQNANNRSMFDLFRIIYDTTKTAEMKKTEISKYEQEHKIDKAVVLSIAAATSKNLNLDEYFKEGDGNMCTLFEEIEKEGELRGELRGELKGSARQIVRLGRKYRETDESILQELEQELEITREQAISYLEEYDK